MGQSIQEWTKSVLWKTALKKFQGIWSAYPSIFLKGLSQNLLSPLLNTLSQMFDRLNQSSTGLSVLREKCQNTEFSLVLIFPYSGFPFSYISLFSQSTGKYGPEKTPYLDNFQAL